MIPGGSPGSRNPVANQRETHTANYIADLKSLPQASSANICGVANCLTRATWMQSANGPRPPVAPTSSACGQGREVVRSAPKAATSRLTSEKRDCA